MTYLEILSWARKGLAAEKAKLREMQDKAIEGQALQPMEKIRNRSTALRSKSRPSTTSRSCTTESEVTP